MRRDGGWRRFMREELSVTAEGALALRSADGSCRTLDFNTLYAGYYPPCTFHAAGAGLGAYYAAGTEDTGALCLYRSLLGGVWEPVGLTPAAGTRARPAGRCVALLFDEAGSQLLLVCDDGLLIVLPDCPKCVRHQRISDTTVISARLAEGRLYITTAQGEERCVPLEAITQYRVSRSFARTLLRQGATLADVRDEITTPGPEGSVHIPLSQLPRRLADSPRDSVWLFVCHYGTQADEAARLARERGFHKAYSMGGLHPSSYTE